MTQKITKEILLDLQERSECGTMSKEQAAAWLPHICNYAMKLLRERESREGMIEMVNKVAQIKKARTE
tara:strand:+ start:4286 stop:4489 length:204 start_codon:yes stop_codon:yes gene_type:complete